MRYLLVLLSLLVTGTVQAIDCRKMPNCADLGFSQEEDKNCAKDGYINCPFDTSYRKCVQHDCEKLGFTESDKSSWCASVISCKSDSAMTLCQKPCIATTYDELKDLAESGECKIVTMKNDITIPENQGITLHADTIIEGSGHTLTSSGNIKSLIVFSMNNKTGMKNLKLQHTHTGSHSGVELLKALTYTTAVTLKDVDIFISSDDNSSWTSVIDNGAYNISGNFMLDMELRRSGAQLAGFWKGTYNFTDAQVSIKGRGNTVNIFDVSKVTFANSTLHAETSGFLFVRSSSMTVKNSEAGFKGESLFSAPETNSKLDLILEEKASLALELTKETDKDKTTITTTDNTSKLIVNGKTYKPVKVGTTKLSEIESSPNWKAE